MLPTTPFHLERHFAAHEFTARCLLSSSDCDAIALDDVIAHFDDDVAARWRSLTLGYTESRGLPLLRDEIARDYEAVDRDLVLTVVPEEGVLLALSALVEPGTPVVVTSPAYQSLAEVARHRGGTVTHWQPRVTGDQLHFDLDDLQDILGRTAQLNLPPVVVVNFPHNPTGALPSQGEWQTLFDIVGQAGGRVFSDEMYRHLELRAREALRSAVDVDDRAVVLSGLSKSLSAPGLRTGWLATRDRALLDRLAAMKDWTTICAPAPAELLAVAVLRRRRELEAKNRGIVAANVAAVAAVLAAALADANALDNGGNNGLQFFSPQAGSVALLRLAVNDAAAVCDRILRETGSMLVPASLFDNADGGAFAGFVRLGLGRASFAADFAAVVDRLR